FLYVWPWSRPAILIPLLLWTMYLVNKAVVASPVLSLIDEAAEKVGLDPVPAPPKPAEKPQTAAQPDIDLEEHSPSIAERPRHSLFQIPRRHGIGRDARSGCECWVSRPFEHPRQRRWVDSVPPSVGRKGHACFVVTARWLNRAGQRSDASHSCPL